MKSMYIGSGDVTALMSGITTETHRKLLRRFVSDEIPYYNSLHSPIDPLRAGAILEGRFFQVLGDDYLPQYKAICSIFNVCRSSLDFAKIEANKVVDFIELKTSYINDFLDINMYRDTPVEEYLPFIKKKYKDNYEQVQFQLICTGLNKATLCYLEVQTYDDEENYKRDIQPDEYVMFEIPRDEETTSKLTERISIFQSIKDYYVKF